MPLFTDPLDHLMDLLKRLPGIGSKSSQRLALHILKADEPYVASLLEAVVKARSLVRLCSECNSYTDRDVCEICSNPIRDQGAICVVEKPFDVASIERTGRFRGTYHVLHGALSPIDGIGPGELKFSNIFNRLKRHTVKEVIVATNPDVEGEATAIYIAKTLKPLEIRVSRIALGLPVGSELEFADDVTLSRALDGRTDM